MKAFCSGFINPDGIEASVRRIIKAMKSTVFPKKPFVNHSA